MKLIIEQFRKELVQLATYKQDTVKNYISLLYKYFQYAENILKIDPLLSQSKHLRQWMDINQKLYSPSRMTHYRAALKHFFEFLVKIGINQNNPADALLPIRKNKSNKNQPLSNETLFKLLRSIKQEKWSDQRNFIMTSILWALGLRVNELVSLKLRDFESQHDPDCKIGLLRIHGKNNKERALFVVDKLYYNLMQYLSHPQSPKKLSDPLFPSIKNKTISKDRVRNILKIYAQNAGLKQHITPHVLRHSFATHMYEQGIPIDAIEAMLGHENQAETSIYIHVSDKIKKQTLENITIEEK